MQLQLNDFDISCFKYENHLRQIRPVGTRGFWSPRMDVPVDNWIYSEEDDWMSLALTFAFWLGIYSAPKTVVPADIAAVKKNAVKTLLDSQIAPSDLKTFLRTTLTDPSCFSSGHS